MIRLTVLTFTLCLIAAAVDRLQSSAEAPQQLDSAKAATDKPESGKSETAKPEAKPEKELLTYKDHALPILRKYCVNCHNPDKATSDLNVMTYQSLIAGGASGETISPGSPDQSLLYQSFTSR